MEFYSHYRQESSTEYRMQTVAAHCRGAAQYAQAALWPIGLGQAGYLAALLHDMGKMKREFQAYLLEGKGQRGSVNHTFAACRWLLNTFHGAEAGGPEDLTAELLAFAVGAHHGLFDCVDQEGASGFLHRLAKEGIGYQESLENFLSQCADGEELTGLFRSAHRELSPIYEQLSRLAGPEDEESFHFYLGLLARLLLSAVIEGDRRDTAEFMTGRSYPPEPEDYAAFWGRYLAAVEEKLARFPQETPLQWARSTISRQCRDFAAQKGGILQLNVPTGGGKTLSALRYALAHAQAWGKRRLIFTAPLLTILEQNAAVIRSYLGDDTIVLEHHSNVVEPEEGDGLDLRELAVDSWSRPVIVTTLVQLLNTLFAGKTTAIRRFQSLCSSVIVIDEVQTVPTRMLSLFNLAVNFLADVCGATVVLCSATQPPLERLTRPLHPSPRRMVPYDSRLWAPFRRTQLLDGGKMTLEATAAFAADMLREVRSLLIICNKKEQAAYLLQALQGQAELCCHLSTAMCPAHRQDTLAQLYRALETGQRCLCVSTQVIEAGVDISFQRVIRLTAGMDNVVQSAGRCNRNGEADCAPVTLITLLDESLGHLEEIRRAKDASVSLLSDYRREPELFDHDLASERAIACYYDNLYRAMPREFTDYLLPRARVSLFSLLGSNSCSGCAPGSSYGRFYLNQAFRTAGSAFTVFDSDTRDVVVPYGTGAALIAELAGHSRTDVAFMTRWLAQAKPYTVALYSYQLQQLSDVLTEYDGILTLPPEYYDEQLGLCTRPGELTLLEV